MNETKSTRIGQTVFFRHKYITAPQFTASDALLHASDELCAALTKAAPHSAETKRVVQLLMDIVTRKANEAKTKEDARRQERHTSQAQRAEHEKAPAQRVPSTAQEETKQPERPGQGEPTLIPEDDESTTSDEPDADADDATHPNIITQADDDAPAYRTRARHDRLLAAINKGHSCPTARQTAARKFSPQFFSDYVNAVLDEETGELLEYRHLIKHPKFKNDWGYSFGNEIGRLAQGMPGHNTGTNTIFFIRKADIPPERWKDIAFSRIVCNVRPHKSEVNRTRLTYGGSNLDVPMDCGTPTADLITIKLLLNSVISTKGARFMCIDIKDFYLNTPMDRPEYLRMKLAHFPQDVIDHYNLNNLVDEKGFVYVRCERGMYGLPHAGIIAQKLLEKRLSEHGYRQSDHTPGFWTHEWRPICFSLIVDDFGVKYVGR